jgi:hypothetical protein
VIRVVTHNPTAEWLALSKDTGRKVNSARRRRDVVLMACRISHHYFGRNASV